MSQDWDIQSRAEVCGSCSTPFADRSPYYSTLVFDTEGYTRRDFCEPCWLQRPPETSTPHSAWKGIFRCPPPPAEEPLKKETAESVLRKLIEDQDPSRGNVMYILAVMLERKRVLVERDVQLQDGVMTRVYEHRQTGETFVVVDPRLALDALGTVQAEVIELLGVRSNKDAEAGESAETAKAAGDEPTPPKDGEAVAAEAPGA